MIQWNSAQFNKIELYGEYDVLVAGGGIAGVGAGWAAAKAGCKTLIIENGSALGGLVTLGLVNIPLDFVSGLGTDMMERLDAVGGHWHRNTDPEKHKLILDRMTRESGCEILLVTPVVDSIVDGDTIRGVIIATKTGFKKILAERVIDCTGDSDAAFHAGAETRMGRESDNMSQGCSLEFMLAGVNWEEYVTSDLKRDDPRWLNIIRKGLESGDLPYEVDNHLNWITHLPGRPQHCGMDEVSICFAHSRNCYPCDNRDLTRMYLEGREQAEFLSKFIKKNIPGFQNSYLSVTASLLGVRESRRIVGEYSLTAADIAHLRKFDDVICISSHGFDIHNFDGPGNIKWAPIEVDGKLRYVICNPMGFATTTPPPDNQPVVNIKGQNAQFAQFEQNGYYDIPYRCLLPVRMENLLAAGRNLSSDVYGQSGARLIMACLSMGEAAGTAAAMSLQAGVTPRALDIKALQRRLLENRVNLGQKWRAIAGVTDRSQFNDDNYVNPELAGQNRNTTVKDAVNEFTRK